MARKHLHRHPKNVSPPREDVWWYEDNGGIEIHVEPHERHVCVRIPWRKIREALARKDLEE